MEIKTKIKQLITTLLDNIKERKKMILALSCLVVFFTTYLLILPAFTLDKEEAAEQGGIDVPGVEQSVDADETVKEPAVSEPAKTAPKEAAKTDVKKKSADVTLKNDESDDFSVAVESKDAVLSEDMSVAVREIGQSDKKQKEEYESFYNDALEAVQKAEKKEGLEKPSDFAFAKFYDISLMDGDDEVEPESAVDVKISFSKDLQKELKVTDPDRLHIVHFAVDKTSGEVTPEVLDADTTDIKVKNNKVTEAAFTADSFSVFAVVYTTLEKTYISASGDTYDIKVTYDETAEIPDNAELEVREIAADSKEYKENVSAANKETASKNMGEFVDPVQFDISIVADGKEIEPKEGSTVKVEIKLAKSVFEGETAEKDEASDTESKSDENDGFFMFNGQKISTKETENNDITGCRVVHITDEKSVEEINDVASSVEDGNVIMQFETDSFSDYLFDGNGGNGLYNLPTTIYVGDEIYMWNQANYWVTEIGNIVNETKANGSDNHKTVTAIKTGTFRIYNRYNTGEYREITVRPARTGTTPPTIETVDNTSLGITLNLFDYDLDGSLDSYFNGSSHNDNPLSTFAGESGSINAGNALKFWGSGIGNNYGSLNQYQEHGVTSIVENTLNTGAAGGYPVVRSNAGGTGNRNLTYLFSPSDGTDKKAYTNVNGLFKKEGDYYVYDSNTNYAWYNPSTNSFEVYEDTYYQHSGSESGPQHTTPKAIGFFPFHKYDKDYDLYVNWNKNLNHHFGMSMSVDFSLPKNPKAVEDTNGNPIVFEFSGDDDLWVFIDGKLAMDIGGIHQPTSGKINFAEKYVEVNGSRQTGFDFTGLDDGEKHTLQVFYIERGGCDSNCMIKFNLTQYGDIHFDKVDEDKPADTLAGAVFGIYKDSACTEPLMERLYNGTSRAYIAESDAIGHVQFSDIPLGTYYLKELHAPEGYPLDNTVHIVQVYIDQNTGQVKVKVTIDTVDVETGVLITNKKPAPINLGLKKEWQNEDGDPINAPDGATATFEIKRIRTYETYEEEEIEGQGRESSHISVGWIHGDQNTVYKEYDLIADSTATISWSYVDGYNGSKDCVVNGERIDKDYVTGNVVSEAITMPAAGESATFYIIDESDNGEAIRNINVAGQQFYGNSGGGVIHTFKTVTEPDPDFSYTGENVTNNQVTLPIGTNTWQYLFNNLPIFGRGRVSGVDYDVSFNYTYYLEEVSNTAPEGTTVIYKDFNGNEIHSPNDVETSSSGTETIINRVPIGSLKISKNVSIPTGLASNLADGTYTFEIWNAANTAQITKKYDGTDIGTLQLTISNGVAAELTVDKLLAGTYIIKETGSTNNATIIDTSVDGYDSSVGGIRVTVTSDDESDIQTAAFTNKYEVTDARVKKVWSGDVASDRPQSLTVTLLADGEATSRTVTLNASNGWEGEITNLPKYNRGNEIVYHWAESDLPEGYFLTNYAEDGTLTTLTNTKSEYDLKTSYTGIKTWDDEGNKYSTRPSELIVTLYANDVALTNVPEWNFNYATNQWEYTFKDLPVFDENGDVISYRAEETVPTGYNKTDQSDTPTSWNIGTITYQSGTGRTTPDNKLTWKLGSLIDLSFIAVKPTSAGAVTIWTHRVPTPAEKTAIQNLIKSNALPGCKDRDIVWYSGVSANMDTPHGPIHVTYDESELEVTLVFEAPNEWSQFIWGQFNKNNTSSYDIGTTAFTNSLETTSLDGTKTWIIDGDEVPADPILTLSRTYSITEGEGDETTTTQSAPEVVKVEGENLQPVWSGTGKNKTFTYSGLPKRAPNGSEYTYTVVEASFTIGTGDNKVTYTAVRGANGTYTVTADKEGAEVFNVTQSGNDIVNSVVKASIEIIKVEEGHRDTDHVLNGAQFQLTRVNDTDDYDMEGADAYKSEIQTVENGITTFTGLKPGRYKLEEKKAPDGYVMVETQWFITIDISGVATLTAEYTMASENAAAPNSFFIENEPGAELPHTGGIGTAVFYILGSILIAASGMMLWRRRKTI